MARKKAKANETPTDADGEGAGQADEQARPRPAPASVPAKASCLTFIVLLLSTVTVVSLIWWNERSMPLGWPGQIVVGLLVCIIPIVVYRAVALWMFDEVSRYPDISQAWHAGIAELGLHGLSLSSSPLFLIIGTGNDKLRTSFMGAAADDFIVDGVPVAPAALYWYANADGIFLYLNDISWMNAAITLYELHAEEIKAGRQMPGEVPNNPAATRKAARAFGTLVPDALSAPAKQQLPQPSDQQAIGDLNPPTAAPQTAAENTEQGRPQVRSAARYLGTITPDQIVAPPAVGGGPRFAVPNAGARSTTASSGRATNRLTSQQSSQQLQRLEHVCGLLRRSRHPVCPANGILALLPFEMLKAGDQDVAELERAVAADLSTIYRELELRCPVTAVVVGMEQEKGFRELIRRIGRQDSAKQRFGQRFDLRAPATVDELRKFTSHVCGTFEDWVYTLFREEQALSHPGNTSLYALLCKVRRTLKTRLGDVLGKGFGYNRQSGNPPMLFSGCYFAATGPKLDRQAFVSGLLSKLYDEQEDIEWTEDALREDRRRGWLTRIGWLTCAAVLLFVVIWYAVKGS
jgi:hypothetical protein